MRQTWLIIKNGSSFYGRIHSLKVSYWHQLKRFIWTKRAKKIITNSLLQLKIAAVDSKTTHVKMKSSLLNINQNINLQLQRHLPTNHKIKTKNFLPFKNVKKYSILSRNSLNSKHQTCSVQMILFYHRTTRITHID